MNPKSSIRENIKIYAFIALLLIIFIYFIFKIFNFIYGPIITIYSPKPGEIVKSDTFNVVGNVKNARNIYLNGKEITIDENGDFKEEIISKYPYTLIVINATDKYEKTREKTFDVGKE